MKFGFNFLLWTTFVTDEQLPQFALLKEVGYDGIEIPVGDGPVSHYLDLAPKIRDHGLEVTAVAMGLPQADPSSSDPTIRQAGLDRLRSRIECAHTVGCCSWDDAIHRDSSMGRHRRYPASRAA